MINENKTYYPVLNGSEADPFRNERGLKRNWYENDSSEFNSYSDRLGISNEPAVSNIHKRIVNYELSYDDKSATVMPIEQFLSQKLSDLKISDNVIKGYAASDLFNRDHELVVLILNKLAVEQAEILKLDLAQNGEKSRLALEQAFLEKGMANFANYVNNLLEHNSTVLQEMIDRYDYSDQVAFNEIQEEGLDKERAMIRRAARRLLAVQKDPTQIQIDWITDFDLTLSTVPGAIKEDARAYLEPNVPSSAPAEEDLEKNGREVFAKTFALYWNNFLSGSPNLFYEAGRADRIALRPGVNELFTWIKNKGWNPTILSANFGWIVKGALENVPDADSARIIAVWANDIRSTMKDKALQYMALETPNSANIFVGDGSSDKPAVDARHTSAFNFALRGHGFAKQLEEVGATYFEYEDMNDVMEITEKILAECQMLVDRVQRFAQKVSVTV
jgi:2-hydroxy-3-keto-5-methylthiopentenyl-1-phosphate phosphatase